MALKLRLILSLGNQEKFHEVVVGGEYEDSCTCAILYFTKTYCSKTIQTDLIFFFFLF